jgi:pSer/pThr/pTyr-binding forkhead associated (FHA) protein
MQEGRRELYVRLSWHDVVTNEGQERIAPLPVTLGRAIDNTIVLNSQLVSRQHAVLMTSLGGIILQDQKSHNGVFVGQERITHVLLQDGSSFRIGPFHFIMTMVPAPPPQVDQPSPGIQTSAPPVGGVQATTLFFSNVTGALMPQTPPVEVPALHMLFRQPIVPLREVYRNREAVLETTYLTIGGGIGSFAWVDHLRICGVPSDQIVALGTDPKPTGRYERLARNSQIPIHERLRSNSEACPDNIWGWPTYGMREIWLALCQGQLGQALRTAVQIFGEPVLTETYTPRAGVVFDSVDREARRIDWGQIWRYGWVQVLRKTNDGRYVVVYSRVNSRGERKQQVVIARYIHLAMGYPGIQILADLQEYRQRTLDFKQAVNAYEEHDHIYKHLLKHGGVAIVRGRGIVASRVIQRLYEVRAQNQNKGLVVLHIHRSPVPVGHQYGHAHRQVKNHIEVQPFTWPKACSTGSLRLRLEQASDQERDQMLNDWGGTTTADRKDWQRILQEGLQQGWYQIYFGQAKRIDRTSRGQLTTHLSTGRPNQPEISLTADFIIDCTGLEATLDDNPLLKDIVNCYQLRRNPKGRLSITNDFEIEGMDNGLGRVYASGSATLGGPYAAVDSFLGLQYAALCSMEALEALQAPWLQRLTPLRSFLQWMRWVRGVRP